MMSSSLPSPDPVRYSSIVWHESQTHHGVRFAVRRSSLAQKIELTARIRELTQKYDFLRAGDATENLEASLSELFVTKLYVEWGTAALENLIIDGDTAGIETLIERGPEDLVHEIAAAVRNHIGVSEEERKNS